jgi:hypothetical protein
MDESIWGCHSSWLNVLFPQGDLDPVVFWWARREKGTFGARAPKGVSHYRTGRAPTEICRLAAGEVGGMRAWQKAHFALAKLGVAECVCSLLKFLAACIPLWEVLCTCGGGGQGLASPSRTRNDLRHAKIGLETSALEPETGGSPRRQPTRFKWPFRKPSVVPVPGAHLE